MISNVSINNFRGLKSINLDALKRVTLISGKNNAGKSSILEGLFLMLDHITPESFVKIRSFRGLPITTEPSALWTPVFYGLNTENDLQISVCLNGMETTLTYSRDDSFVPYDTNGVPQDVLNQFVSSAKSTYTLKFHFAHGDYTEDGHFIMNSSGMM